MGRRAFLLVKSGHIPSVSPLIIAEHGFTNGSIVLNLDDPHGIRINPEGRLTRAITPTEIEELVKMVRLSLYNSNVFYGAQAIQWELNDLGVSHCHRCVQLTEFWFARFNQSSHREVSAQGQGYPVLPAEHPNQIHQADFVGPCYLKGPIRFYSLNMVDLCTGRCGVEPLYSRSGQAIVDGFWAIWKRVGMPSHLQVDNEMSFYGSPTHPRGMGPLIRLCLHNDVHVWFIPVNEPWRNGVVENSMTIMIKSFFISHMGSRA